MSGRSSTAIRSGSQASRCDDRRRRRLAGLDRRRGLAAKRPAVGGRRPRAGVLRAGGTEPTNTDANLVLGRLGDELIAGAMTLDSGKAEEALRKVAEPLDLGVTEAAEAVIAVANANMADAIRLISVRRGYDPREFALVCFGGAGPLHGAARPRARDPDRAGAPNPGTTSALGCLLVDIRHDFFTLLLGTLDDVDPEQVEREFEKLEEEAMERMRVEGVSPDKVDLQRTIDMRYAGQWRSIAVPVDGKVTSLDDLAGTFEDEHDREHSYRREGSPIEIYRLNLRAVGVTQKAELARHEREGSMPEPIARRQVHFGGGDARETPVYRRADVPAGATFAGPAVLEQLDSTVLVPPGAEVEVDDWLNIRMAIEEEGMSNDQTTLDPVTFEVLKNAFVTIVDQMAEQILRTCHSFVIYSRVSHPPSATRRATRSCREARTSRSTSAPSTSPPGRWSTRSRTRCAPATSSINDPYVGGTTSTTCASCDRSSTMASSSASPNRTALGRHGAASRLLRRQRQGPLR